MKKKTWALLCLLGIVGAYAFISAVVIAIDPFQVYRLATRYMPPIDNITQVYANAGIVRSYDYDSAIVGTSVTENFRPTQMDELLGGRFIKLCTSAGTAYNHALLLNLAFDTHEIKRIVYGLDVYSFIAGLDHTGSEVPLYLYDRNPFNDVQYWLNRSVLVPFCRAACAPGGRRRLTPSATACTAGPARIITVWLRSTMRSFRRWRPCVRQMRMWKRRSQT